MKDDQQAAGAPAFAKTGRPERPAGPLLKEYKRPSECTRKPSAEVALVHFYRNGGHSVVTAMGTEHVDRPRFGRPVTICEVARGTHLCQLSLKVPAVGSATFFQVEADVYWSVTDYRKVVDGQVTDVAERLKGPLLERLRTICSGYPVGAAAEVDRAAKAACRNGQWDDLGYDLGLHADLYVRVAVDATTIEYADHARKADQQDLTTARDRDRERAAEYHRTELLQIRMRAFRAMLEGGEWNQICFMLSDDPDQARAFMELLRQEARADKQELLNHTLRLVEKGVIQSAELESQVRELLGTGTYRIEGSFGRPPVREAARRPELPSKDHGRPDDRRGGGTSFTPSWVDPGPAPRDRDRGPDRTEAPPAARPSEAFDDWDHAGPEAAPADRPAPEDRRRDRRDDRDERDERDERDDRDDR
ncbi:hypothetical protein AB0E96_39900, partial [Kitasatospora sp. NPDC036755]|uniref:hypothetical protein n=1 Tax=Kitasatospora sp. NPDC036755 TaxID=3154600 RepID=UPI0033DA1C55